MQCCHGSSFRKPKKRLYYRPILSIIDELLQHEFFLKSLDFQNLDSSGQALTDVMDGPIAKHHLNAMQQYADTWINSRLEKESQQNQSYTTTSTNYKRQKMNAYEYDDQQALLLTRSLADDIKPVNLLLSLGYDGAQVFKHKVDHFYPLILSILNLPPSFRKVVSVGSFVLSLLNSSQGSQHENFIFRDCLLEELQALYNGILMTVNGKRYFVQARLILHTYDTKAMEKILKFRSVTSQNCCPLCRAVYGTRNKELGNVIWEGCRYLLDYEHALRPLGQSQQCCPRDYHIGGCVEAYEKLIDSKDAMHEPIENKKSLSIYPLFSTINELKPCNIYDDAIIQKIKDFLKGKTDRDGFIWYHSSINFWTFRNYLFYHHADFRQRETHSRVTNLEFLRDAIFAHIANNEKLNNDDKPDVDVNGVYGVWLFALLRYTEVDKMICWDPFHALKNILKYLLELLVNSRRISGKCRKFCKETRCHPLLYMKSLRKEIYKKGQSKKGKRTLKKKNAATTVVKDENLVDVLENSDAATKDYNNTVDNENNDDDDDDTDGFPGPWVINKATIKRVDAGMACVLYPRSYSRDHKVINPMSCFKKLPGVTLINWLTNFLYFILHIIRMYQPFYPRAYFGFLVTLIEDLRDLQCTSFDEESDIDDLFCRIVELVGIQHGLFPITESRMPWHQLIDIVPFIKLFGPIRGWWTLGPERVISTLKQSMKKKGGPSFYMTVIKRHIATEIHKLRKFYSDGDDIFNPSNTQNQNKLSKLNNIFIEINRECGKVIHSEQATKIVQRKSKDFYCIQTEYDRHGYLLCLIHKVQSIVGVNNVARALRTSRLCRMWVSYQKNYPRLSVQKFGGFIYFGQYLNYIRKHDRVLSLNLLHGGPEESFEILSLSDETLLEIITLQGKIFYVDYLYYKSLDDVAFCKMFQLPIYKAAYIGGKYFSSRGEECCETHSPIDGRSYATKNDCNNIKNHLFLPEYYSSWFHFDYVSYPPFTNSSRIIGGDTAASALVNNEEGQQNVVGQFNFFTRVPEINEPLLDGLLIAAATCREARFLNIDLVEKNGTYVKDEQLQVVTDLMYIDCSNKHESLLINTERMSPSFVSLSQVYSNPLAVVPLDSSFRPISFTYAQIVGTETIYYVLLIGLFPSRKKLKGNNHHCHNNVNSSFCDEDYDKEVVEDVNEVLSFEQEGSFPSETFRTNIRSSKRINNELVDDDLSSHQGVEKEEDYNNDDDDNDSDNSSDEESIDNDEEDEYR
jgi:hypothetical protein